MTPGGTTPPSIAMLCTALVAASLPATARAAKVGPDQGSPYAWAAPAPKGPASSRAAAPRHLLRRAIDHYVAGRYAAAVSTLRSLVEARVLTDRADQEEALRIYGIALYLTGAVVGAERSFRDLLRLNPSARLDPAFVRPEVVSFFERVRRRLSGELDSIVRKRGPRGTALVNLLPPWGQFQNGHRGKAYVLLASELGLAATSITTAALLYSWRSSTGEFGEREPAYQSLSIINAVSFGALIALFTYGVIDGLYFYYQGPRSQPSPSARRAALFAF